LADFTTNVSGVPQGGVTPQAPVVDNSSLITMNAIGNIGAKLLTVGAEVIQNKQKVDQQNNLNNVITSFSQKQLKLADAVEQGVMSSQEARMRMRKNYTEEISNNPSLTKVLAQTQADIINTAGLGKIVAEGTEQEKINVALQKEATMAGWIKPDASPDEQQAGIAAYSQFKRHEADINAQQNALQLAASQVGYERAKIGLATDRIQQVTAGYAQQSARINLIEARQQQQARQTVGGLADSYNFKFNQDLQEIERRKDAGEITPQEAIRLADQQFATISQLVSSVGRDAGGDYVNNITAPMRMRYENSVKFLNGEIDKQILGNENERTVALQMKNALGNPKVAQVVATSRLLGNANLALIPGVNEAVMSILDRNTNPETKPADVLPDTPDDKADVGNYLGVLKSSMGNYTGGNVNGPKEETEAQLNANITNVLRGIDVHSVAVNNPAEYNQVVDFLASPEFGKFTSSGGGIYQDAAQNASTVLQTQYVDQLLPLLKKEYESATLGARIPERGSTANPTGKSVGGVPASNKIQPFFSGGGVVFRAVDGANDVATRNKVKDLNNKVGSVLNKLLRMDAHLSGNTDYKAAYERYAPSIFGEEQPVKNTEAPAQSVDYGSRPDGSAKGTGFFGELELPGGGVATEYSMSVDDIQVNGRPVDFPTLVPTLTKEERDLMINDIIPNDKQPPKEIVNKAIDFARSRIEQGLPLFATPEEEGKFR
jgi:cell fate (sporulation/competence/biofilm development) regulator YlbF (YheA/YmcA/DUF963 family)